MQDNPDHSFIKIVIAWIGLVGGGMSLNTLVLITTLIFTVLQICMILRRLYKGLP